MKSEMYGLCKRGFELNEEFLQKLKNAFIEEKELMKNSMFFNFYH